MIDESVDVDPNYDPSEFLMAGLPQKKEEKVETLSAPADREIHNDLAVSDSDEEMLNQSNPPLDDEDGDLYF